MSGLLLDSFCSKPFQQASWLEMVRLLVCIISMLERFWRLASPQRSGLEIVPFKCFVCLALFSLCGRILTRHTSNSQHVLANKLTSEPDQSYSIDRFKQ